MTVTAPGTRSPTEKWQCYACCRAIAATRRSPDALFISTNTVNSHVSHIYTKFGAHSRADAIAVAHERGLLDPDSPTNTPSIDINDFLAQREYGRHASDGADRSRGARPGVGELALPDELETLLEAGVSGAHERALGRLRVALARSTTVNDIATVTARNVASLLGADYSNLALIDGPSLRIAHHEYLDDAIATRYRMVPFDDSTPLGTAARSGEPVILPSLQSYEPRYAHMIADTAAAGIVATVSYPVIGHGAIGVAWTRERALALDSTIRILAEVAQECAGALR